MTSLSQDGATDTIYIFQADGSYIYRVNQGTPIGLTFPVTITNTNVAPASNILKVLFETDLVFTNNDHRFWVQSSGIQIGDTTLPNTGVKRTITIDGVTDYIGLIDSSAPYDSVFVYNLHVTTANGATLATYGGWIGQMNYGAGCTNHFIIGCSSDGDIPASGGGIVGSNSAYLLNAETSDLTIVGCWSSGSIANGAGGIVGESAGLNGGEITILKCSSSGTIGTNAGGIVGQNAGQDGGTCMVQKSYSTGTIGTAAGGIFGYFAGSAGQAIAEYCYSRGTIGTDAGAIMGTNAAASSGTTIVSNCYGIGSGKEEGVYGTGANEGASSTNIYIANPWTDTEAIAAGLDYTVYISTGINTPYELRNIGPSPYSLTTIGDEDTTIQYAQTIAAGSSTTAAVLAGLSSFSILEIDGESPAETPTITINATTGVISTTNETSPSDYYTVVVRAVTNPYTITRVNLTVTEAPPEPPPSATPVPAPSGKGFDFEIYNALQAGNSLVIERLQTTNLRFKSFEDYNKYRKAFATLKR
jgi:hypothetical protein